MKYDEVASEAVHCARNHDEVPQMRLDMLTESVGLYMTLHG